ncbi:hypothetical protein MTX78_09500 [Hymenobacter tibetensis]|uniref:Uncharacterized protein n=1 Tax=Hymenobacter tibetensis TaxID=497967 RepID=A0ABY4D3P5_9BACT|nr:hypothetical protein [Hymenobacter tibetensis]UOG76817.1 hypothetical protein MTX78_09500 [Hymenobacter tibetensis]
MIASIEGRAIPSSTYPRQLSELHYGSENLSPYAISLTFSNETATLACVLPKDYISQAHLDKTDPMAHLWGQSLVATTDTGEKFEARQGYCTHQSIIFASEGGGRRISITAREWQLTRHKPHLWVGRLAGTFPQGIGNLNLRVEIEDRGSSFSLTNFVLKGSRWTYFLLRKNDKKKTDNTLVIDTNGGDIDHILLNNELQILSYCLGQPLYCNFLVGLDEEMQSVAYAGGDYGFERILPNHNFSPVPRDSNKPWFTVFFQAITQQLAHLEELSRKQTLFETITLSVESSAEVHYISRETKAVLACLAAARLFVKDEVNLTSLSNDEWAIWIKENNALLSVAAEDTKDLLLSRVLSANEPGPVELTILALKMASLPLNPDLIQAIAESSVLLSGRSFETSYKESDNRCRRLRTLCAGLMAASVGYKGPLAGWELDEPKWYGEEPATEWLVIDSDVQPSYFVAQVNNLLPILSTAELWPTFERPSIPDGSLVLLVEEFARSLASRTNEQVRARILPLPVFSSNEAQLYDFILEAVQQPQTNTVLFTIRQEYKSAKLDILSWEEEIDTIEDEKALIQFLRGVALAPRTRHAVERLLLVTPYEI